MQHAGAPDILVVDDEPDLRETLRMVLEDAGYTVAEAANGREALEQCLAAAPRAILLDLRMPVVSGRDFLVERALTPAVRRIPVVVFSAELQVMLDDVDAVVSKPPDIELLLSTLRRVLAERAEPLPPELAEGARVRR